MKKREAVSHIMTKKVLSAKVVDSLSAVAKLMEERNIRHLPITDGDKVVGMISSTDLAKFNLMDIYGQGGSKAALMDSVALKDLMSSNLVTIDAETPIIEVAEVFIAHHFNALPVVENEKLVGIVTTTDILKYLVSLY